MEFKECIKHWVSKDDEIRKYKEIIKELTDQKKDIEEDIFKIVNNNNLNNSEVKIKDSVLSFKNTKQQSGVTLKHVQNCLEKCIENEEHIKIIMDTIINERTTKITETINRKYI